MINFNEIKGFICDMDGVIYRGNQIIPGVREFIDWLHAENKKFLFLTNNSCYTPRELQQKLARMGLDVSEDHFYTTSPSHRPAHFPFLELGMNISSLPPPLKGPPSSWVL